MIGGLLFMSVAANAQFRRYYPPQGRWVPQDNVDRNGEIQKNQPNYRNNSPSKLSLNLNYGISQPLGSLTDYTDKTSFNGWDFAILYELNPQWQVGLNIGFYDYQKKIPRKVYPHNGSTISAVQTHAIRLTPIQPTVLYFLNEENQKIKPYVGLGVGVTNVNYRKYWGKFAEKDNSIAFSASPMVGIRIPFSATSPFEFNADVKYNFSTYNKNGINKISTVQANVGLSLQIR